MDEESHSPADQTLPQQTSERVSQTQEASGPTGKRSPRDNKGKKDRASLSPPMRLNPEVAAALTDIVGTLSGTPRAACQLEQGVLFVPLGELARRGIDARRAQRALADAAMLAPQPDGERIHTRDVQGTKVPGILIDAAFVSGCQAAGALPVPRREEE
jgi:conjugal transfer pilus assembly protein TraI